MRLQQIQQFDGSIYTFEVLSGSDVYHLPLMPTSVPIGNAKDQLGKHVHHFGLLLRLGTICSVKGEIHWNELLENMNAAFRYLESADMIVETILINQEDFDDFYKTLGKEYLKQVGNIIYLWTAILKTGKIIEKGTFVCETAPAKDIID